MFRRPMLFYDFVYVCLFAFGFLQHVFGHGVESEAVDFTKWLVLFGSSPADLTLP